MEAEREIEPEADNQEVAPEEKKEEPPKPEEGGGGEVETVQEIQEIVEPTSEPRSVQEQEQQEIQEQELDSSSIIEMEVDDSNTGDTITSNPEIDLGSAAAAATAVIMEEPENEGDKSGDEVTIVEEHVVAEVKDEEQEISEVEVVPPPEDGSGEKETRKEEEEDHAEIREIVLDDGPPERETQEEEEEPQVVTLEDESEEEKMMERPGISSPDEIMEMDISQTEPENGDDVIPFDSEMDADMIGEGDASEVEQDKAYLNEEESLSSLPEDAAETDKENNDLICDDQNDDDEDDDYLEITRRRISQDREGNCYCGKDRNFNIAELLCASCYRWFHESCISYQLGKLVPFTTNYVFTCKNCSMTGLECFKRNQAQFSQMCVTALANLTQASSKEGTHIKLFSKDRDIIPFFEIHWEALTTTTRRVTQSWHSTVTKTLMKDAGIVYTCQEIPGDEYSPYFGLLSDDLSTIRPNYEAMIKAGQLKVTDQRNSSAALRGRGAKRRTVQDSSNINNQSQIAKKPRGESFGPKPVIGHGYPTEHPFNKDSYRYILAEPDPNAPFRQEFDESNEWSGKPIHGWLCRVVNPPHVLLALHDRATQLKISEDRLSVTGDKGYCMIRATHSVNRGSWYFEAKITDMPEGSATRIGFCQQFGNLQGPLGFDRYGYSWRSRYGTAFHEARGKSYAKGGYGLEDVLGFMIVLPDDKKVPLVPTSFKDRPLVKVKSHLYYEDKDDPKEIERRDLRKNSKIICFKNGVCQGIMYSDIFCGNYYPAISVYKSITVRCNFGPDFWAPPNPSEFDYKGMCERAEDSTIEQTMADMLYLTENDGQLHLDNAVPLPM